MSESIRDDTPGWLTEAQVHVARLEDALQVWQQRDPANPRREVRHAGDEACRACDEIVACFHRLRWRLTREMGAYEQGVTRGAGMD